MAIISIGLINKKLLYPLIYLITFALLNIFWSFYESNLVTLAIESFGTSIGQILTVFLNIKFKYKFKKNDTIKHKYFKDFSIQFLINVIFSISSLFGSYLEKVDEKETNNVNKFYINVNKFYINDALIIIFITIITYFILKEKYYIHHIISIIVIVILSTSIDLILQNFFGLNVFLVINSILYVLADSILFSYYKYLIEFQYYYFLDVLLAEGIIHFSISLISFCVILLVQHLNNSKTILSEFLDYYENFGIGNILLLFFISLIFKGFFISFLDFLILKELTPNFVIIAYGLARIPSSIIKLESEYRWIILVISIFQVIFILFYLEIIEYNFCNLNKNTKRNISERELKLENYIKANENVDITDEITINGYDITEGFKNEDRKLTESSEEEDNINY